MKTLVKILKVKAGFVHYAEINRKTKEVMIEDCNTLENFKRALASKDYGFQLTGINTKARALKVLEMFGEVVENWTYCNVFGYSLDLKVEPYDNGYGYMQEWSGVSGSTREELVRNVLI